ncbi:MAG: hypothetical protein LBF58_02435 [Deltaproteobacteria bacterium]|nr:hypothetical protein [Deltaproteobacteria bacterium]
MPEYYHPSGKFSPAALIFIPLVTSVVASILGIAYAYLTWYNPIVYIGIVFPLAYSYGVYFFSSWALDITPVRNNLLAFVLFFFGGLVGYVFHALVWLNLFIHQTDQVFQIGSDSRAFGFVVSTVNWKVLVSEALNLEYSINYLLMVIDRGVWTLLGHEVMGLPYRLIWLGEFLIFTVTLAAFCRNEARKPFCETLGQYLQKKTLPHLLRVPYELDGLKYKFEQGDYGYIMVADIEPNSRYNHIRIELYYLDEVDDAYLTVILVTHANNKKEETKLLEYAGIPKIQADQLIRRYGEEIEYEVY